MLCQLALGTADLAKVVVKKNCALDQNLDVPRSGSGAGKASSQHNLRSSGSSMSLVPPLTRSLTQGDVRFDQDEPDSGCPPGGPHGGGAKSHHNLHSKSSSASGGGGWGNSCQGGSRGSINGPGSHHQDKKSFSQVWSLTQFYSFDFLQSTIRVKKGVFTNTQSRLASFAFDGVLLPPRSAS